MRLVILLTINIVSLISGQILLKLGMRNLGGVALEDVASNPLTVFRVFLNPYVFTGLLFYVANIFIWFDLISKQNLSYVYPFLSLGYAGVVIASAVILGEEMSWQRLVGVAVICIGVYIVARS
jgi:drug/metabolite transporter (DMT)-like permease